MLRLTAVTLVLVAALEMCAGTVAHAQVRGSADDRRVDELFAAYDRAAGPGLAVAVVRDGRVVLTRGYGLANLEHGVSITPATVFDVASVSKQFAGIAIAMLAAQGALGLDDDVRRYIPELPDFGRPITIRHLVHHTSGLRDWPGTLSVAGWRFDDVLSFDQILAMAYAQKTLNFEPGAEYSYSNTGYNLLAETVARITGVSFREWTDEHVFRPLGMRDSHFQDDHTEVVARRAFGYSGDAERGFRSVTNNLTALGSSSLFSTVEDLARWLIDFDEQRAGGAAVHQLMRTRGVLNDGSTIPYAFGISHGEYRGVPTLSHSGSWAAFSTYLVNFPEQRFGVVVLSNGGVNATRAAFNVADIFLEYELAAQPPDLSAARPPVAVPATVLDTYVGLYKLGPGWYVRIRRSGGALTAQATGEDEVPMTARSETEFWVESYGAAIVFERDESGRAAAFEYRGRRAPRVADEPLTPVARYTEFVGDYDSDELHTSYRVELDGGALVMRHPRHGRFTLAPVRGDEFSGSAWFLGAVEFRRDAGGNVVGMMVTAGERSRDMWFGKR